MFSMGFIKSFLGIFLFSLLVGCALQPSVEELKRVLGSTLDQDLKKSMGDKLMGISAQDLIGVAGVNITSLRVIDCSRKGLKRFRCEIFLEYHIDFKEKSIGALFQGIGSVKGLHQVDLFKDGDGWLVLELVPAL